MSKFYLLPCRRQPVAEVHISAWSCSQRETWAEGKVRLRCDQRELYWGHLFVPILEANCTLSVPCQYLGAEKKAYNYHSLVSCMALGAWIVLVNIRLVQRPGHFCIENSSKIDRKALNVSFLAHQPRILPVWYKFNNILSLSVSLSPSLPHSPSSPKRNIHTL